MEEYTVSMLSALIKKTMEDCFHDITLKAEVSALKVSTSGHLYFSLKDSDSVIDAVCWKWTALKQKIKLENGMEIRCFGKVTTYHGSSKYQFLVESFELAGIGALLKMLEERKNKLLKEGLFDESHKKKLPYIPKRIGIITSPTGAVIKDMLHRISQRLPREVLLWPVLVQGEDAANQISDAIYGMNRLSDEMRPDLLIVARGGGSFEDLMPFNEEIVVRAVAASDIPVISAVGHETDTTLIDYAADKRAPTPTAAAEFAVPERSKLMSDVNNAFARLFSMIINYIRHKKLFLNSNKVLNIQSVVNEKMQKNDFVYDRMASIIKNKITIAKTSVSSISLSKPVLQVNTSELMKRIDLSFNLQFQSMASKLALFANSIEANSYTNILKKGFALVESKDGHVISSSKDAVKRESFDLIFADGRVQISKKSSQISLF